MRGKFEEIVCVVPINDSGEVYTARMKTDADNRLAHDNERHFVGGAINNKESPEDAAIRHFYEKTGAILKLEEALTTMQREDTLKSGGTRTVTSYWFIATISGENQPDIRPDADIENGLWCILEALCDNHDDEYLGAVAWDRTPMALLRRVLDGKIDTLPFTVTT